MLQIKKIEYRDGATVLEGYCAYDDTFRGKKPAVLISHDWSGRNEFAGKKAEKIAELGYVGFALDMYGKGKIGSTPEEKMMLMTPFMEDRAKLLKRISAALDVVNKLEFVNPAKIGAIGFCFGGLCALDLARSGADIKGVVSFHGLLSPSTVKNNKPILAKVLALHGHDDPMGLPEQVLAFENEMTEKGVDWQVHVYGNTKHAFTNPAANDTKLGLIYNNIAEKRSWVAMTNFFSEIFS